jgi:hypothetical protein
VHPREHGLVMADIDTDRLIAIVTGIQLKAELGDRPLAYRVEQAVRERLAAALGKTPEGEPPRLAPAVVSDVFYLNHDDIQRRPTISIGGPGMNAVSAMLVEQLPTAVAIEDTLLIQMDLEMEDPRCAVWGMNHLDTVRAVETFLAKGYLDTFVKGVLARADADAED